MPYELRNCWAIAVCVLIDCAQRLMDDKQLAAARLDGLAAAALENDGAAALAEHALFRNAARPTVIRSVLKQAYPSGANVDEALVQLLFEPTQRAGAAEAFRGFINLFDDHLAPNLMAELSIPVDLIWGETDPWEPLPEARVWKETLECVRSLTVISGAGHCPHDEAPDQVNPVLIKLVEAVNQPQQAT